MTRALIIFNDEGRLAHGTAEDRIAVVGAEKQAMAIASALTGRGFEPVLMGAGDDVARLATTVQAHGDGIVFNCVESFRGEPRLEYAVAGILELVGCAYTGSPALTLAIAQDKALCKRMLVAAGLPVARSCVLSKAEDPLPDGFSGPYFVKLRYQDASHGITDANVCATEDALRARARELIATYGEDLLVEELLPGREFNIGVLFAGEVLPIAEIEYDTPEGVPKIMTFGAKWHEDSERYRQTMPRCPAQSLDGAMEARLRELARAAFAALNCRDYARVDVRLAADGTPRILEVNPNPDLSPDAGLARAARKRGLEYEDLVTQIARAALARKRKVSS